MPGLITTSEALAALHCLTDAHQDELATVIDDATALLETYCNRALVAREIAESLYPGTTRTIRLRNTPVVDVARLAGGPAAVLTVSAAGLAGVASRASVAMDCTGDPPYLSAAGLTLTSVAGGAATTDTLAFGPDSGAGESATLGDLATAINAVSGWSATVAAGLDGLATADLLPDVGSRPALGSPATLYACTADLNDYDLDPLAGKLILPALYLPRYRYPDRTWDGGPRAGLVWCRYTGGFRVVPSDVKRACVLTVKAIFDSAPFPGVFASEQTSSGSDSYSYTRATDPRIIPGYARSALAKHRRRLI